MGVWHDIYFYLPFVGGCVAHSQGVSGHPDCALTTLSCSGQRMLQIGGGSWWTLQTEKIGRTIF